MIRYQNDLSGIDAENLEGGFFVGWLNTPTAEAHLEILRRSYAVVLALNEFSQVVGFINAVSDGVCAAYLPLLEVLPEYQGRGIGRELVQRLLEMLSNLYMIDLTCDPELSPFYERLGFVKGTAMLRRNYDRQSCG